MDQTLPDLGQAWAWLGGSDQGWIWWVLLTKTVNIFNCYNKSFPNLGKLDWVWVSAIVTSSLIFVLLFFFLFLLLVKLNLFFYFIYYYLKALFIFVSE